MHLNLILTTFSKRIDEFGARLECEISSIQLSCWLFVYCTFGIIDFIFQWDGLILTTWHEFQILHRAEHMSYANCWIYTFYRMHIVPEWIFSLAHSLVLHLKTILQSQAAINICASLLSLNWMLKHANTHKDIISMYSHRSVHIYSSTRT